MLSIPFTKNGFRFWDYPIVMPETAHPDVNVYDMRVVKHEDGWIYGLFCTERKDPTVLLGTLPAQRRLAALLVPKI